MSQEKTQGIQQQGDPVLGPRSLEPQSRHTVDHRSPRGPAHQPQPNHGYA